MDGIGDGPGGEGGAEAAFGKSAPPSASASALVVADAGWFTTEHLFREAPESSPTLLLRCNDYRNAMRKGIGPREWLFPSPAVETRPGLWSRTLSLPPGWMKTYPKLGMRPIARAIRAWRRAAAPGRRLALVTTYPYYDALAAMVRPELSVYLNLDDYALYWPRRAADARRRERDWVARCDLTLAVSARRAEELRASVPAAAARIHHLPHGYPGRPPTLEEFEPAAGAEAGAPPPADLARLPRPWLGFVGSLEDRVDWRLLDRLAVELPDASLALVGNIHPAPAGAAWAEARARCLSRPNVHALGWRPQGEIEAYNRAFDAGLIPYDAEHPFNLACCPTKIMDVLGTGRPIVSTAIPECRLYRDVFEVAETSSDFVEAVRRLLAVGDPPERRAARLARAADQTCARQMERFLALLATVDANPDRTGRG